MKLLFVVDPLASLKPYKDSSVAMMRAAVARGHAVFATEARQLQVKDGITHAACDALDVRADNDWVRVTRTGGAFALPRSKASREATHSEPRPALCKPPQPYDSALRVLPPAMSAGIR